LVQGQDIRPGAIVITAYFEKQAQLQALLVQGLHQGAYIDIKNRY
jgi:hypothetical protein